MQKHVNLVDLAKSFPMNVYYLLTKIGVDTAENEPLKVHSIFKLWDLIFADPPLERYMTSSGSREEPWTIEFLLRFVVTSSGNIEVARTAPCKAAPRVAEVCCAALKTNQLLKHSTVPSCRQIKVLVVRWAISVMLNLDVIVKEKSDENSWRKIMIFSPTCLI